MSKAKRTILPSVDMTPATKSMLDDICKKRKDFGAPIFTKRAVIADLVLTAHKKECKFTNRRGEQ